MKRFQNILENKSVLSFYQLSFFFRNVTSLLICMCYLSCKSWAVIVIGKSLLLLLFYLTTIALQAGLFFSQHPLITALEGNNQISSTDC